MTREIDTPAGGAATPPQEPTRLSGPSEGAIRARASGYGYLSYFLQGRYENLSDDGRNISIGETRVPMASVPPGDSYNSLHYAKSPGEIAAESELLAATIRIKGRLEDAVPCDMTWTAPGGRTMWSGNATVGDPQDSGRQYWGYVDFWSWIGRDFSQGGNAEIINTGTHTIEFDTNYGTFSRDFEVVGPSVTTCSTPDAVERGKSAEVSVTVSNVGGQSYSGEVRWARDSDRRDILTRDSFTVGPNGVDTVTSYIPSDKIEPDEDVVAYCLL